MVSKQYFPRGATIDDSEEGCDGHLRPSARRLGRRLDLEEDHPLLRAAGHDVHATTATGLGDRVHLTDPAIDLMPGFLVIDPYAEWIRGLTPDPADHAWLFAKLVPQSLATYTQPIRLGNPAAAALPRAFIFCTEGKGDVAVDPTVRTASRIRSAPGWRYRELADTHLAPVNGPQATAEALLSLV